MIGCVFIVRFLSSDPSQTSHIASIWSTTQAIDNARLETEKEAFAKLIDDFVIVWNGILKEYKK
jgi:hypothetical protein